MRLCIFRQSDDIPAGQLADVCRTVGGILGVTPAAVEEPLCETDPGRFFEISASFLERGEAIVAIVFTTGNCGEGVLGEGVQRSRGAWVKFSPDKNRTVQTTLHEIGHICEASHCTDKTCLMFPYYVPRPIDGQVLADLLCRSCNRVISESWVYRRLRRTEMETEGKQGGGLKKVARNRTGQDVVPDTSPDKSFPDWSLPREEFITQVKQFFGYE